MLLAARCHWHSEENAAELVTSAVVHLVGDQLRSEQVELISVLEGASPTESHRQLKPLSWSSRPLGGHWELQRHKWRL